jgi:phosphatidylserine/phosphatidylglycerophosphate/cardiolipin synthase-like enzyme
VTPVKVAIPLFRGKRKFFLDKGRPWSVVEHLILAALAETPRSAAEVAKEGRLPHRLVIEVVIRLMRAGWVELNETSKGSCFRATAAGRKAAGLDELPSAPKRMSRWMNFVIDRISGTIYRSREMPFHHENEIRSRAERELIVVIEPRDIPPNFGVHDLVDCLFADDERFVAVDPAGDRLMERFGLVTVRGAEIDGLPSRAPQELKTAILEAAFSVRALRAGTPNLAFRPSEPTRGEGIRPPPREVAFGPQDLVIGGDAHQAMFEHMLSHARRRVVIHSTFVRVDRFDEQLDVLAAAAKNGVIIDILWGEGDRVGLEGRTRAAVKLIRQQLQDAGLHEMIRLHAFTTRSHAKFILADKGESVVGLVGSCNWFTTDFSNFEVSARLRDPALVSDLAYVAAELSRGAHGLWTELTTSLARLAEEARLSPQPTGPRVTGRLVLGPEHKGYVRDARDAAQSYLLVASHQLSPAARQAVLVPALAAPAASALTMDAYYELGSLAGPSADADSKVKFHQVKRMHAKFLAWDHNNLVITSQNWLSADPSAANPLREIGVFISSPGIAEPVVSAVEALFIEAGG